MNKKIVTFGEILFRLSKENHFRLPQGHVFNGDFGGSEANVAVSLAVMGDQVEYVTRVPDNAIGHASLMHLREFGLDVKHVVLGGDRLGSYFFESAAAMRNSMVVYDRENSSFYTLKHGDIQWEPIFQDAVLFHWSWPRAWELKSLATSTTARICGDIPGQMHRRRCTDSWNTVHLSLEIRTNGR